MTTAVPPVLPSNRPALVWVISLLYFAGAALLPLSYLIIYSGVFPLPAEQKEYFANQTIFDHSLTLVVTLINLVGAVHLFLLKKQAFLFFLSAFVLGVFVTVYQIFAKNWLSAIDLTGSISTVMGWIIGIAILVYTKRLQAKDVLR